MTNKLINKIASYPVLAIIALGLLIYVFISFGFSFLYEYIKEYIGSINNDSINESVLGYGLIRSIILLGILGPIIETFLAQWLPIKLLCKIKNIPYWIPITVSAILFGIGHTYSVLYVIYGCIIGLLLATLFFILKLKKSYRFAFWIITLLHAMHNTFAIFDTLFKIT